MCRAMPFSARTLKKNFVWRWCNGKKQIGLSWSVLLSTTSARHYSFPKHFILTHCVFLHVERVCKSFWKESLTRTNTCVHAVRALKSPSRCFQIWHWLNSTDLGLIDMFLCRNCCLYIIIQKIAPQTKSGKYFRICFFLRFGGKKWRRSEHVHASYSGLSFRSPGFSSFLGREERKVQGLDYWMS